MSIWEPGPFENDDAADWVTEVEEDPGLELIEDALSEVADPAHVGYLEIPDGAIAVAAAELVAQLLGRPGARSVVEGEILDEETFSSLAEGAQRLEARGEERLVGHALTAVDRVLNDKENSELRQVLEEDKAAISALTSAVQDLPHPPPALSGNLKRGGPDELQR